VIGFLITFLPTERLIWGNLPPKLDHDQVDHNDTGGIVVVPSGKYASTEKFLIMINTIVGREETTSSDEL